MDPMDPMDWLENEELLRFFRRHKTEMSCMEKPDTFLRQLRDYDLVTEDRYKKVSRMKSRDNVKKGIYEILDCLEKERPHDIKEFWRSVFQEIILNEYPTLRLLCNSLVDDDEEDERKVFRVTCGGIAGTLHKKRFASGTCGKSIRTEMSWMTPMEFLKEASCPTESQWKKDIKWEGKPLGNLIKDNILRIHQLSCPCNMCKPDCKEQENQKNDDECCICKSEEGEELVVCDQCPRSFHQNCHLPHIEDSVLGDDRAWMCTFCEFRTSREWLHWDEQERNAVMLRQISKCMRQCHYLLLYLCSADEEQMFATNPCLYLEDYSTVINTPMWLGKLTDKLQKRLYQTVSEFVADVHLIFTNCASYNRDKPEFFAMGNSLKELFDREFKSVFNIREQSNS